MTDTEATEAARKRLAEEREATEQSRTAPEHANEAARRRLTEEREIVEISRAEYAERAKGKPTPTQEENDLAALGAHVVEKEEDGSPPDPNVRQAKQRLETRQSEAAKPTAGGYETRAQQPRSTPPQQPKRPNE